MDSSEPLRKGKAPRILVIEDEPETQRLIEWILKLEGMRVEVASNGQEALAQLEREETHPLPDLILLDLLMPVLNGVEFLELVRTIQKNLPRSLRDSAI